LEAREEEGHVELVGQLEVEIELEEEEEESVESEEEEEECVELEVWVEAEAGCSLHHLPMWSLSGPKPCW
jgi:hypothetical protein